MFYFDLSWMEVKSFLWIFRSHLNKKKVIYIHIKICVLLGMMCSMNPKVLGWKDQFPTCWKLKQVPAGSICQSRSTKTEPADEVRSFKDVGGESPKRKPSCNAPARHIQATASCVRCRGEKVMGDRPVIQFLGGYQLLNSLAADSSPWWDLRVFSHNYSCL